MAQYGIGLSALNAFSEAIDVTSNNIANAQTVGYKQGDFIFADQFFKAQNPQSRDRAGMGTSRMMIRRANTYGTISGTQNPLDLAIAGPGMFMLAKQVDGTIPTENPSKFQYTRNGQFAIDNQNRIVNENGMFLVGYAADASGNVIESTKSVLKMDTTPLAQQATKASTIEVNLDARSSVITGGIFDPKNQASYSQTTSQTVYDDKGQSHTLSVYYKKVNSADLILSQDTSTNTFKFQPKQNLGTLLNGEQVNTIASTAAPGSVSGLEQTLNNTVLTYVSGGSESITGLKSVTISSVGSGYRPGIYKNVALMGGSGTGALATVTIASDGTLGSVEVTNSGSGYLDSEAISVSTASIGGTGSGIGLTLAATRLPGAPPSAFISDKKDGYSARTETSVVTFNALEANKTVSLGGLTLTASSALTANQVASAFASVANGTKPADLAGSYTFTGALTGFSTGTANGRAITFTHAANEVNTLTFGALAAYDSVTIAGLRFTAGASSVSPAELANAYKNLSNGATMQSGRTDLNVRNIANNATIGTFSGALAGWSSAVDASGASLAFSTADPGNVDPVAISGATLLNITTPTAVAQTLAAATQTYTSTVVGLPAGEISTATTVAQTLAGATQTYTTTVRASGLAINDTVTIGGLRLTATAAMTDIEVADAFRAARSVVVADANYTTGIPNGSMNIPSGGIQAAGFTISTTGAGTAGLTLTSTSVGATAAPTVSTTATGTAPVVLASGVTGVAETQTVTFGDLAIGDTFTLAGRTFTATAFTSAANLRAAFDGTLTGANLSALGTFSGTLTNFTIAAGTGNTAVLTSTLPGDVALVTPVQGTRTIAGTGLENGNTLTIGGLTLTAVNTMSAIEVADNFRAVSGMTNLPDTGLGRYSTGITRGFFNVGGGLPGFTIGGTAGTAGLTLTSTSVGATAAPTVTDTAPGVPVALASGVTGVAETQTVTFGHLAAGDTFTLAGRTFTATAFTSASNLRAAFDGSLTGASLTALGTFSGTLTNFTIAAGTGNTAVLTSTVLGDVNNAAMTQGTLTTASAAPTVEETSPGTQRNINVQDLANTGTGIVTIAKTEGGVKTETSDVTFNDLVTGDSLTIGGLTLNATGTIPAATVASAFANLANGRSGNAVSNGYFTGSLAGYSTAGAAGNVVTFTSATASADVNDLTVATIPIGNLIGGLPGATISKSDGYSARTESNAVTFNALSAGQTISLGGLTLTATSSLTGSTVASAFASAANGTKPADLAGSYTFAGALTGFSTGAADGNVVTFTSSMAISKSDGYSARTESNAVSFNALSTGDTIRLGGLTLTASSALTANQVASAFASVANGTKPADLAGSYTFTGALTGFSTGAVTTGNKVTFTHAANEVDTLTFSDLAARDSLTIGGLTFTAGASPVLAAELANAYKNLSNGATMQSGRTDLNVRNIANSATIGTFSGALAGWSSAASATGASLAFSASSAGNTPISVATLSEVTTPTAVAQTLAAATQTYTSTVVGLPVGEISTVTTVAQTLAGATQTYTSTVGAGLAIGQTATIGGLTLTATAAMTDIEVADAFRAASGQTTANANFTTGIPKGSMNIPSGGLAGFTIGGDAGTAGLTLTSTLVGPRVAPATSGTVTLTLTTGTAGVAETQTVTFGDLAIGDTFTLAGRTFTATAFTSAANLRAAFDGTLTGANLSALGTFSGTLTNFTIAAGTGNTAVLTSTAVGNVDLATMTQGTRTIAGTGLENGNTLTIGGLTLTATGRMTAAQVADAFRAGSGLSSLSGYTTGITNGNLTGGLTGFTIGGTAGTAGLTLTSTSVGATAAPTVTDTAPGVPVALASGVTGVAETQTVTFGHLAAGDTFTLAGRTFTATAFTSASNLRAAFDGSLTGASLTALGTFSGTLTNFTIAAGTGNTAVLTSTVLGDVNNAAMTQGTLTTASAAPTVARTIAGTERNINVQDLANTGTGIVTIAKTEGGVKTETSDVTFNDLVTGDSLTIGGLTLNATGTIPAATVASAFANLANGRSGNAVSNGYFTGSLAGYSTAGAAGNVVTFTSATASADVTDIQGITNTNVADLTNVGTGTLTIVKTEGGVKTEASDVTFRELLSGDSITIGGLTLTASGTIPAASVASAFANIANGRSGNPVANGAFSGTLLGFSTGASAGSTVKFTSAIVNSDVADLTINTNKVGKGSLGATYNLALSDGTNLSVKQISPSGVGEKKYKVETDRFAVYATLDGVPVGQTSTGTGMSSVRIGNELVNEQASLGTMAFVGGKNIDSLSRDQFGKPQFITQISIDASGGAGATWGKTANGGTIQFTLDSTNMTGYSSAAQTYKNTQDGSATSQLTGYSFDSYGKLVAQYDNGKSVTKGQLILATFNNFEGLIPVGGNGFQESAASGAALIDKPNGSQMGAIRAQSLEESNVDLTQQLVKLMVLQRAYSAASQATKIQVATLIDDTLRIGA